MNEERIASLRKQLTIHRRHLGRLEERQAKLGTDAPVSLLNEIDDEKEAVTRIEAELRQLGVLDDVEALRQKYLTYLAQRYEYMDLRHFSQGGR